MSNATLSVALPNYNHAPYIGGALDALLSQSFQPKEIIVLDDGSTDKSLEIIESYARRHPTIRLFQNDRNRGLNYSCNKLLSLATGDYYYGAASDDRVLPGFFHAAMERALRYPQAGLIFGKFVVVDSAYKQTDILEVPHWQHEVYASPDVFLNDYLNVCHATHCLSGATLYRRKCITEIGGYPPELGSHSDMFVIRAVGLKHGAVYMPIICMQWRYIPSGLSVQTMTRVRSILDVVGRTAWLMRSDQFRAHFPEAYVQGFETDFRKSAIHLHLLAEYGRSIAWRQERLARLRSLGVIGRLMGSTLDQFWRLWFRLRRDLERRALRGYHPDLSCYKQYGGATNGQLPKTGALVTLL